MATQIPELFPVPIVDPVSIQINESIDRLILSLEQRRHQLLTELRDRREEISTNRVARQQMEQEMAETKEFLERQIKHNKLHTMQTRMIRDLEAKMAEMQVAAPPQEVSYLCDTRELEERISRLGEIVQLEIPPIPPVPAIPNYATFQQPILAVGKEGSAAGEFSRPRGVSIHTESGHIYVADMSNSRVQIFSETGDYLNQFRDHNLIQPWGILIHQDNIYVTDKNQHAIFLFKLPDLTMVKRVGKKGSGNEEFNKPGQLDISPKQHLYVADQNNNRLQFLTANLSFQGSVTHQTMTTPVDVKFTNSEMFVLSYNDNPCIHVFSHSGEKSRSLVTRGYGMQLKGAFFFCLDSHNNIVITDELSDRIMVFSPKGDLLHTIGNQNINTPYGIAIIGSKKLVFVTDAMNSSLQIFSA